MYMQGKCMQIAERLSIYNNFIHLHNNLLYMILLYMPTLTLYILTII